MDDGALVSRMVGHRVMWDTPFWDWTGWTGGAQRHANMPPLALWYALCCLGFASFTTLLELPSRFLSVSTRTSGLNEYHMYWVVTWVQIDHVFHNSELLWHLKANFKQLTALVWCGSIIGGGDKPPKSKFAILTTVIVVTKNRTKVPKNPYPIFQITLRQGHFKILAPRGPPPGWVSGLKWVLELKFGVFWCM